MSKVFASVVFEGPSGLDLDFKCGNVTLLYPEVGEIIETALNAISYGGVCVFMNYITKRDEFNEFLREKYRDWKIFEEPRGRKSQVGSQFKDKLDKFNRASERGKAVFLTYYNGKMTRLAKETYGKSKVIIFVGLQHQRGRFRDFAVDKLRKRINICLKYQPDNDRVFIILGKDIYDELETLPQQVRHASDDTYVECSDGLRRFCSSRGL